MFWHEHADGCPCMACKEGDLRKRLEGGVGKNKESRGDKQCFCCGRYKVDCGWSLVGGVPVCNACVKDEHPVWEGKEAGVIFTITKTCGCKFALTTVGGKALVKEALLKAPEAICEKCGAKGKMRISVNRTYHGDSAGYASLDNWEEKEDDRPEPLAAVEFRGKKTEEAVAVHEKGG